MEATNAGSNSVKVLSDDEVREIVAGRDINVASWDDVHALCQTVQALQAKYDAEDRDHRLTIDTFRQQERIWQQKFDEQESEKHRPA